MKQAISFCLMTVIITGLFIIAGMTQGQAASPSAAQLFKQNCSACHAGGGNVVNPKMPLNGGELLKTYETFLSQVRKPQPPMPTFTPAQISDEQARKLYDYILKQNAAGWK